MTSKNSYLNSQNSLNTNPPVHALIVAAGKGSRFGAAIPKQYTNVYHKTVLEHTVSAVSNSHYINHLHLVIAEDDRIAASLDFDLAMTITIGGAERWQSVHAGVKAIIAGGSKPEDLVLIHDAARPCIHADHINKVIDVARYEVFGAILGVPIVDTIKQVKSEQIVISTTSIEANESVKSTIVKTIDRHQLWNAQTPQVFRLGELMAVLNDVAQHNATVTDEASAFELKGHPIRMVEGSSHNLKLTYPEDINLIEMILASRLSPL